MKLTDEQKTNYTRIALQLCDIGVDNYHAELFWRQYEAVAKAGGKHTLHDTLDIKEQVKKKYKNELKGHSYKKDVEEMKRDLKAILNRVTAGEAKSAEENHEKSKKG